VTDRLAGKVSVVTGAGGGLGQAAALTFAGEGATVVAAELNADLLAKTAELAEASGTPIHTSIADLTTEDGAQGLMDGVVQQHGRIDSLITAASFVHFAPIGEMTLPQWQHTMKGELDTVFLSIRAAWPHMVAQRSGSIVNFGSLAGWRATRGLGASAHAVGKGGMIAFSRQLALEGGPHGIRVNSVSPGVIETPGGREAFKHVPAFEEGARTKTIINRLGSPQDIAWGLVYLCSDEASWITGTDLIIDGGASAW
jgi:NAD(P)-dependent dehydrogenase (short-subunit alcohol dehydrogenase family)